MANHTQETEITTKEKKLIEILRNTSYGDITVTVEDKQPAVVEEAVKSIKL
ncbi:hypothetical protein OXPF_27810 [Oxobacter pfennigii]|uniref:DUF2292 domain-containing protein n=1 Tax=Oxobacter pfennigii TaxID=36849 RepID=A0A0P8W5U1_9CLOT|nr:hypothetical protein [Oxobacter pfennigii]KPU43340.1 hypothetical protein OXPF_27810 [Oxobacter pfennigii]